VGASIALNRLDANVTSGVAPVSGFGVCHVGDSRGRPVSERTRSTETRREEGRRSACRRSAYRSACNRFTFYRSVTNWSTLTASSRLRGLADGRNATEESHEG
jgi:hypothetical protein